MVKIEEIRKARNMSRQKLADSVGIKQTSVYRYERKGRIPDAIIAARMAKSLGCRVEDMVTEEEYRVAN